MDMSLCAPRGLDESLPAGRNTNLPMFALSPAFRGFPETLGKEALLDWMETP